MYGDLRYCPACGKPHVEDDRMYEVDICPYCKADLTAFDAKDDTDGS